MILAWVLYSLAIGTLSALAATACERLLRDLGRAARLVWVGAIALTIVLSIAGLREARATPESRLAFGDLIETTAEPPALREASRVDVAVFRVRELAGMAGTLVVSGARAARRAAGDANDLITTVFSTLWIAVSAALLLVLGFTVGRMSRARKGWREHQVDEWRVMVSQDAGPALVGFLNAVIVIPAWLLNESVERQRLVVRHEHEHQRAGDHFLLAFVCLAVCFMPWNPALWWMLRRTRLAIELDCDARVLRGGAGVKSYGMLLLDIAGHARSARPFTAPALVDARTQLERRVLAMVHQHRTPRPLQALAFGALALTLTAAACATEMPTAAQIDDLDVEQAQEQALHAGILERNTAEGPLYVVDGVIVSEAVARSIAPDEIAAIEVLKGEAAYREYGDVAARGAMLVRTRTPLRLDDSAVATEARKDGVRLQVAEVPIEWKASTLTPLEVEGKPATRERVNTTDKPVAGAAVYSPAEDERKKVRFESAVSSKLRLSAPMIVLDGKVASGTFEMRELTSYDIESIEVVKGEAARRLYNDPRAANGVVRITTKKK